MRPGRSAWTLAVVALGVGALFLVGWRIGTGGDALSAPSTPIDSPYFAVDVASSGPRARIRREKEDEKKEEEEKEEEEEEGERGEIEREDRSAPSRDYSPAGRETRGAPRSKRRSEERSKGSSNNPPPNLENGSTIDFGRKKDEEESGSRATDKLLSFPWTRNLEERGEDDDESEDGSRSRGIGWGGNAGDKVASSLSSDLARKKGNRAGDSRKISFPWNPEREEDENSDGSRRYSLERVVGRSRESFEDDRESTSYWVSGSPSLRVDRDSLASLDPEEEKDGIKDDRSSWTSYPAEKSLPLSNVETKERRIEDVSLNLEDRRDPSINFEKNQEKWIDRRSKEGNFLGTEMDGKEEERASGRTARRNESYRGDENAWRRENNRETSEDPITKGIDLLPSSQRSGKRGRGEEDGTRFSTDDDEQRTRTGTLNGPSERSSDVEENLSREVNGRSMNEVEKNSGQSYLGSGRSLTSDARVNRGETEPRKAESIVIPPESESGHHPSNQPRSSSTERGGWRRVPWNTNKKEEEHVDERSISIEEVGTRWNEIVADFHNSERAEQGYGRGGESISPDSYPPATPMPPRDLFFRRDHGSSANTFVSGRGEGNWDRGNILEGARPPIVHSPTIDIRGIDEKLENNDDNDDDDGDDSRLEGLRRESFDEEFPSAVEERHGKEEDLGRESSENLVGGEEKTGDEWSNEIVEKFERRAGRIRRRRYANYYSQQSATPMAYVHIQPVYPVAQAPPPNRKCVQCMVVYKPCPSTPRQPPFPTYKYQELASKWFGLKYGCRCNPVGSVSSTCDIVTGQCQCKPHVAGRQCDQCTVGFWGLPGGAGCAPCGCDPIGARNSSCHEAVGQCYCKQGVGGTRCDTCLPGYYGFSSNGCQACDPCVRPGHICDPDTGRCVCPTLTFGEHCDRCRPGSWDLVAGVGCRPCACTLGSTKPHCDHRGQCPCRIGYAGLRCERCAKGYYGYPRCRPCGCNAAGTTRCDRETCDCDDEGQCPCKEHAVGRQCDRCKEGTFGLAVDNPKGCTECFCFGRTTSCRQAGLSWGQRRLPRPRTLYVNDTINEIAVSKFRSKIFLSPVNGGLNMTNGLSTIPDTEGDVTIPAHLYYNYPFYWMLPDSFLGDKVVSYGGFLRFTSSTEGGIPLRSTFQYPIVQLQGNDKIVLEYYLPVPVNDNHYEVRFHESLWQLQNRPDYKVTREVLMVALQNLQYILIKASDNAEFTKATLLEASMDAAVLTPTHIPQLATGVEICKCPPEYNSTSCQDPSIGYYRWYKNTTVTSTIVIDLVGEAKACQCNGRSNICNIETGYCLNCRGNTAGPRCDICADSFYGHADFGCKPCPCPQADKRFSSTCTILANAEPICVCKPGYTGRKCERCSAGYYGFPHLPAGKCTPCECNPAGSLNDECDTETGQCRCRAGSTGRDCSECTAYRHVFINNVCTSCNDNCTGILLDNLAALSQELAEGTVHIADGYVPPPWQELSYIDSNTTEYLEEINRRNRLKQRMKNIPWNKYRELLKEVEVLLRAANEQVKRSDNLNSKSNDLKNNIFSAKIEMDNLKKYIEDTILLLNQYSNENKRIELKKALKTAKMILNGMKEANLTRKRMEVESFLGDAQETIGWLNSLYDATEPLAIAQDDAEEYSIKLNDVRSIIEETMETLFTYDGLYNDINETFSKAKNHCDEINGLRNNVNSSIVEGEKLTNETRGFILDFQNNVQDLPELRNKLAYWFDKLGMKEELLYRLNYEYNDTYVIPAIAHVKNLSSYVDQYVSLFSETRNIAASPLKASQAYKNIVDNIRSANITAMEGKEITNDAYNKTFPNGPNSKSLLDIAKEVSRASSKQLERAKQHEELVKKASVELELQKEAVTLLKNTLNNTGIRDNQVNLKLQKLKDDSKKLREDVENILKENEMVLENVKISRKLVEDYEEGIADRLKPKLNELKREGDSKISLASEKLTEALSNTKKADARLISFSNAAAKRKNVFDKWNDTLATKLQNLKDKIAEARNTADGIRVSLKSAEGKECSRSYRPSTLQPTSTNTIVMTFALPKGKKEGSLFYLPSSINDDFIALELVDRKVRFVWNVGGGTGILTHPEIIHSSDIQDDKFWYRIEAERVRHVGKLHVRKQVSTSRGYPVVKNSTSSEYGRFDITTSDRVWIGKIPRPERRRTELIASTGLPGCIHQVILDGKPIGLWNFVTTAPDMACEACVEGVEDVSDDTVYSFNGEGYAVRNRVSSGPYNPYRFVISINFRTYDENALLFLAINPDNNQHVIIFLREGKVILQIGYGSNVSMEMSSNFKYNTGNWTKVDAFRYYQLHKNIEKCSLSVGENDKRIGAPATQPKKEDIPNFLQAKYYIGGVPPSFRADKLMLPSQVSFLGCMSNIIIEVGYDPMAEQYYGVEPICANKPLRLVGFYGDGYLQHAAYTLRKINSTVSFSFRTMQEKAVLLLSTFEGQEERMPLIRHMNDESNKKSYYSVCIMNGQVEVRLNAGKGELVLQSNDTFNDGRYHSVTIIKRRKDVELRIDDAYQTAGKLPTSAAIKAPEENGGLFFGGLPVLINNTEMISTTTPLYGAIKDAIFNDDIIRFDEVISFEHALIGRSGPSMGKDPPTYTPSASLSRGMSTQPEGCQKVPYYSLEAGALKFGDKPNSHTQLYLNFKKFWEKKYAIEFDFRTYYPNGLLFITPGLRPKHYLMVVIRDGQLLLLVKSKQKKEILFKMPFNDGNWHHVVISHDERKLTLLVDSLTPHTIKVPRKIGLASMMYIGGLPESGTPIPEQVVVKLETLKGCIRGLRINGNVFDMVGSTSRAYQVGQCFPNVESGAYFQDEAYAIYKRNFELGAVLELQLEFRTSELSGVLLSITAPGNSPSLSLELNNGKVIMSGDLGDNNPLYAEQRFTSPYTICDNRWHRIQAVYNDEELALKVDEMDQKYGLPPNVNYHMMDSTISGPLYIGGLPASAPKGTLMTRDHFNGCIRNVMIGGERRDWTDMDELHNIHLSSCPVQ